MQHRPLKPRSLLVLSTQLQTVFWPDCPPSLGPGKAGSGRRWDLNRSLLGWWGINSKIPTLPPALSACDRNSNILFSLLSFPPSLSRHSPHCTFNYTNNITTSSRSHHYVMLLPNPITNINWVIFCQIFSVWMADWRVHIWHHGLQPLQYHQQPLVRTWSVHATRNRHYSKVNFWEDSWWVGNTWFVRKHIVVPGCYLPGWQQYLPRSAHSLAITIWKTSLVPYHIDN